ncbi:MAG: hypothetical protein C4547_01740 [Phycisphaerales bacterium]|nr:MAG: hypothetical protein C4547_01740 [Phycisphaerales bacterium]
MRVLPDAAPLFVLAISNSFRSVAPTAALPFLRAINALSAAALAAPQRVAAPRGDRIGTLIQGFRHVVQVFYGKNRYNSAAGWPDRSGPAPAVHGNDGAVYA